jgi:tRNA pseudouridine55 synthase
MFDFEAGEVLNIDKPADWTSFDVVKKIRNTVRVKKVGHAGTLDPFATGVLLVCTGRATKGIATMVDMPKEYLAIVRFGSETDTYDRTGEVVKTYNPDKSPDVVTIDAALHEFLGETDQIPPMYSARKVKGKRLYKLAREGKTVEREARPVMIYNIERLNYDYPDLEIRVKCSKGTYIRSLAFDLGRKLGIGAYLQALQRTAIGDYRLENAWNLDAFIKTVKVH